MSTWLNHFRRIGAITREDRVVEINDHYVAAICKCGVKSRLRLFKRNELEWTQRYDNEAIAESYAKARVTRGE